VEYNENDLVLPSDPAGISPLFKKPRMKIWVVVNVLMSKMNLLLAILRISCWLVC
jgi:hypothetical protein